MKKTINSYFNTIQVKAIISSIVFFNLIGCTSNKPYEEGSYRQNFDDLKVWYKDAAVSSERSHSGAYSAFVDSTHEFSQTFEMEFNDAKSKGFKSFQFSAWCLKMKEDCKAALVVSVESPDKHLVNQSTEFEKGLEISETWINVTHQIKLPESAPAGTKIKAYLWSPKKDKAFFDDVEVIFSKD